MAPADNNNPLTAKMKKTKKFGRKFPYYNLEECIELAKNIEEKGGGRITQDTLAKSIDSDPKKTAFITRVSAAKHFNLITTKEEFLIPTELAKKIIYPTTTDISKYLKEAFNNCDLFSEIYQHFKGKYLPEREIFENIFIMQYGISSKRTVSIAAKNFIESGIQSGLIVEEDGNYSCVETDELEEIIETTEPAGIDKISKDKDLPLYKSKILKNQGLILNLILNINLDVTQTDEEFKEKLSILKEFISELNDNA